MDITVEAIEALRVPDAFAPVVGFRRFGIPWPSGNENSYELVQKGHRWAPSGSTEAECRRMGTAPCEKDGTGSELWLWPPRLAGSSRSASLL